MEKALVSAKNTQVDPEASPSVQQHYEAFLYPNNCFRRARPIYDFFYLSF